MAANMALKMSAAALYRINDMFLLLLFLLLLPATPSSAWDCHRTADAPI